MNYLKISEIANKLEVKRQNLISYYAIMGKYSNDFKPETKESLYKEIDDLESEIKQLENKLRKLVL